jgi:KaiC/GvpD/RAD55 family RecA-like ATPase
MSRVTASDLRAAAEWLEAYDDGDDMQDGVREKMLRVAAWLEKQADVRDTDAMVSRAMRQLPSGVSRTRVKAALLKLPK